MESVAADDDNDRLLLTVTETNRDIQRILVEQKTWLSCLMSPLQSLDVPTMMKAEASTTDDEMSSCAIAEDGLSTM